MKTIGDKYKVLEIISSINNTNKYEPVDDYIKNTNMLVSVVHTTKNQIIEDVFAHRFISEEAYKEMLFQKDIKNFNL